MPRYLWLSYSGTAEIVLALVLAAMAAAVAYAGLRLPLPARLPRPGRTVTIAMVTIWLLAMVAFLVGASTYVAQAQRDHLAQSSPTDPIMPVTFIGAGAIFFVIALAYSSRGWRIALGSAVLGAAAGPMIFELPFDLIIVSRTYPPIPPDPAFYLFLFFGPLTLIGLMTLVLLTASPAVRLQRSTLWCLAGMLAVFAVWSLFGFGYPSSAAPIAFNVTSKIMALAAALTLFLPARTRPLPAQAASEPPAQGEPATTGNAWTGVM
jgi:hypothetical protein